MPDVTLSGGPRDGQTVTAPDETWPAPTLRFDDGLYRVVDPDATTIMADFYVAAVSGGGASDPLGYDVGPPGDQGPPGPTGEKGDQGERGDDGVAIGLRWQGEWETDTVYAPYDGVSFEGSSYYTEATVDADVDAPPASPWRLLAQAGAQGPPGEDGAGAGSGAMVWGGEWAAGTYAANTVVLHGGRVWIAEVATTTEPSEGVVPTPPTLDTVPSTWITGAGVTDFRIEAPGTYHSPTYIGSSPYCEAIAFETTGTIVTGDYINHRQENMAGANVSRLLCDGPAGGTPVYEGGDLASVSSSASYQSWQLAPNRRYIMVMASRNATEWSEWDVNFTAPSKIRDMTIPPALDWSALT